jgi:hypothetical protein
MTAPPPPDAGRLLLTVHRGHAVASAIGILIGASGVGALLYGASSFYRSSGEMGGALAILLLAIFPGIFIFIGWSGLRVRLRVFEHGVEGRGLVSPARFVAYDEATSLTFFVFVRKVKHTSVGTFVAGSLRGPNGAATFDVPLTPHQAVLVDMRDRASHAIAINAQRAFDRGEKFRWGDVLLTANGLEVDGGLLSYALGYEEAFGSDDYTLWRTEPKRQLMKVAVGGPNFHPGYALFHRMRSRRPWQDPQARFGVQPITR